MRITRRVGPSPRILGQSTDNHTLRTGQNDSRIGTKRVSPLLTGPARDGALRRAGIACGSVVHIQTFFQRLQKALFGDHALDFDARRRSLVTAMSATKACLARRERESSQEERFWKKAISVLNAMAPNPATMPATVAASHKASGLKAASPRAGVTNRGCFVWTKPSDTEGSVDGQQHRCKRIVVKTASKIDPPANCYGCSLVRGVQLTGALALKVELWRSYRA
jgi:hypothetical protein